jgi:hypothetical protein
MSDPNGNDFVPPPLPVSETDAAAMTTGQTLTGIFFEPGRVFESLRERPRFLAAAVALLLMALAITAVLYLRVDMGQYIKDKMDKSPRAAQQTEQQKEMGVKFGKIIGAVVVPASVVVALFAGAALYMLGVMAFGGSITYKKALSVWAYSSFPPSALATLAAVLILFLKSADTIDPEHLLVTNPGAFMGADSSPAVVALLTQFDLLKFYGLFLAALGLRKVAKLSSGSAWTLVISLWVIGTVLRVVSATIFGG